MDKQHLTYECRHTQANKNKEEITYGWKLHSIRSDHISERSYYDEVHA